MTHPSKTTHRVRGAVVQRPRVTPELIVQLARQLTPRDRDLLELVWEHRVFTTDQLTDIFFPSQTRARQRLRKLRHLCALERFQPWTPVGTAPQHWVLGPTGAHVLAVERGVSVREFGYRYTQALSVCTSSRLGHQIGVNAFFARLHAHARQHGHTTGLTQWWSDRRCASLWGDLARPDTYARWTETQEDKRPVTFEFFLEYDTGTETLTRVAGKLAGYAALADSTAITTPVLICLPSERREANLRKVLGTPDVPVATAVHACITTPDGPAGPVWLPAGATGPRRRLAALANAWGAHAQPPDTAPGRA